jgi:hypothetical protein
VNAVSTNYDIVFNIAEIQKPGDLGEFWKTKVRPNKNEWSHPLSELELSYIQAFRDPSTAEPLRMRAPVDPQNLTAEEKQEAQDVFGGGQDAISRYANYENRRRILAHYVYTHPATVRLQLGLYRFFRDINPVHFALERGWQIGGGEEMFTGEEVSRLGAALEFTISLAVIYGVGKVLGAANPNAPKTYGVQPARSLTDPIYDLPPEGGGMWIQGRWYTEHALERMAPNTAKVQAELRTRVMARLERIGIKKGHPAYDRVLARALQKIDPRGVPPSVVEAEILRPGSTNVRVITAKAKKVVVTVIPAKK